MKVVQYNRLAQRVIHSVHFNLLVYITVCTMYVVSNGPFAAGDHGTETTFLTGTSKIKQLNLN